jgi:hypothetical protein
MTTFVGIDIAKEVHWVCAIDPACVALLNRKLLNTPEDLQRLVSELRSLPQPVRVGIDVLGGIASLTQAVLLNAGFELLHVSGLAVNRARQGTVGGESKSDPRDARVIADQVRVRSDLRAVDADSELDIELRLLVSRRQDLITDQTRRLARMHDLLVSIFPELEHALTLTSKTALTLLMRYVTPQELRAAGAGSLVEQLGSLGSSLQHLDATLSNLESVTQNMKEGRGAVGQIVSDEKLGRQVGETIEDVSNYAQRLVGLIGGRMEISSEKGVGTLVTVTLPVEEVAAPTLKQDVDPQPKARVRAG